MRATLQNTTALPSKAPPTFTPVRSGLLQRAASRASSLGHKPPEVPSIVHETLRSPGRPLDAATRASMEPRFGHDFSAVRVHDDARAAASARAVDAHAYTVGNDIVFNTGRYDSRSDSGRRLLAHELAHTIQQRGIQRSAAGVSHPSSTEDRRLESEAECAANAVVSPHQVATPPLKSAGRPVLSRAKATVPSPAAKATDDTKENKQEYGPLINEFGSWVSVKRMNDKVVYGGRPTAPDNKLWPTLIRRGYKNGSYYVRGHLLNDNLGGPGNTWDNLTPLSGKTNNWGEESHLKLFETPVKAAVKEGKAVEFRVEAKYGRTARSADMATLRAKNTPEDDTKADIIDAEQCLAQTLECSAIDLGTGKPVAGLSGPVVTIQNTIDEEIESYTLREPKGSGKGATAETGATEGYQVLVGGQSVTFLVKPGLGDTDLSNQAAAMSAHGMILKTLHRKKSGNDIIDASIVGPPLTIEDKDNVVRLIVDKKTRDLGHEKKKLKIPIEYKPLSPGVITEVNLDDKTGLSGTGTITPSIPLLKGVELGIRFSETELSVTTQVPKDKLKSLPGMRITEAKLAFELAPEFKPSGDISFEIGPLTKPVANGKIAVSADAQGFLAKGDLTAHIPGLQTATGTVTYRREEGWKGGFDITKGENDFIETVAVHVGFSDKDGLDLGGTLGIKLPGEQKVTVAVYKKGDAWVFTGKGEFKPPGELLKPVLIHFSYDGNKLEGSGETGVEFHGLKGHLKVSYVDGNLSGEGTLTMDKKGRASGTIHLKLSPKQKLSAEGDVTIKVTDNLTTTGGIKIDENGKVTLKGALEFPKPLELFKPFQGEYKIFSVGISIPIPGASIGPIGVKARIDGALTAGYHIGPGELRNVKIATVFNPLEDKPDLDLKIQGQLYIAASAHISGSISGSIVLDVGIASASGGLTVTATALLDGHVASQIELHYMKGRFDVKADLDLLLGLALKLALDAFVKAEAGIGPFKVSTRKDWNLASYTYDTGLKLGMKTKTPLYYASDQAFKPPSLDQIEITKPNLDASSMLAKIFDSAGGTEKSK